MSMYETDPITCKLEMHVLHRCGKWVLVQYFTTEPCFSETFIYDTEKNQCYGGYSSVEDQMLVDDWEQLTGETVSYEG
jgi:hypothetical protein